MLNDFLSNPVNKNATIAGAAAGFILMASRADKPTNSDFKNLTIVTIVLGSLATLTYCYGSIGLLGGIGFTVGIAQAERDKNNSIPDKIAKIAVCTLAGVACSLALSFIGSGIVAFNESIKNSFNVGYVFGPGGMHPILIPKA